MYLGNLTIIDCVHCADTIQNSMGSIEECMRINIMGRFEPFGFEYSPQRFGDIEMRGVYGKIEDIKTSIFPFFNGLLHLSSCVDTGIVKDNECGAGNRCGKVINEVRHIFGLYALTACK